MQKLLGLTYTATVFLSAFLLFMVQPMVSKAILPTLGGGPSIWNTSMLFFQVLLLGGYLYAYLLSRLKSPKIQLITHLAFLLGAGTFLPFTTHLTAPDNIASPILYQIGAMTGMIALPFFILSSTAPLLQRWFTHTNHPNAESPYFLYAASNIGSMLGLLLYPLIFEQFFNLSTQSWVWAAGFGFLVLSLVFCGFVSKFHRHSTDYITAQNDPSPPPKLSRMFTWIFLAFVPSSLFLGYTTYVTTEIGSLPLIWVIPLSLYILSMIIAFSNKPFLSLPLTRILFVFLFPFVFGVIPLVSIMDWRSACFQGLFLFIACTLCHQELVSLKPSPKHLTLFYLMMSVGGALGGFFNAILAPLIFVQPYEYMVAIFCTVLCWNISMKLEWKHSLKSKSFIIFIAIVVLSVCAFFLGIKDSTRNYNLFIVPFLLVLVPMLANTRALFVAASLTFFLAIPIIPWELGVQKIAMARNYFGLLSIYDQEGVRYMANGTTRHGGQATDEQYKKIPLTYYHQDTTNGHAITIAQSKKLNLTVGVLGLGAGTVAALMRPTDTVTFYDINPDVVDFATNKDYFSYLHDSPASYAIITGDARLKISAVPDHTYDVLLVDVFSSDNIPMHLITKEAAELYLKKTKKDGMIIFHISSRYYILANELARIANVTGTECFNKNINKKNIEGTPLVYQATESSVLTNNPQYIEEFLKDGWTESEADTKRPWSDDFANPLRALMLFDQSH